MLAFTTLTDRASVLSFVARTRTILRLAALTGVLALAMRPAAASAAESPTDTDRAGLTHVLVIEPSSAISCNEDAGFDLDDGEDRFDEGDDEYDVTCPHSVFGGGSCLDDSEDRFDAADDQSGSDDECEGGCADFDDGEDTCLDDVEDRFDEGDDEFSAGSQAIEQRPATTSTGGFIDPSIPGALAGVIGLGAGGLWLLRRPRR